MDRARRGVTIRPNRLLQRQGSQTSSGGGPSGNHYDLETGEKYWVSGVKRNGQDRHWAGSGKIAIEASAVAEYLELVRLSDLDVSRFDVIPDFEIPDPSQFYTLENQKLNPSRSSENVKTVYERFINDELSLEDAVSRLRELAHSNIEAGTLELDKLPEMKRERAARLLGALTEPAYSAFMRGEITADAAAREIAPYLLPHSVFALNLCVPKNSNPVEAMARFKELNEQLVAHMSRGHEGDTPES